MGILCPLPKVFIDFELEKANLSMWKSRVKMADNTSNMETATAVFADWWKLSPPPCGASIAP
jgi:hypothetical protein